jgi:transcriptional regulator with XRE-family HTH domain
MRCRILEIRQTLGLTQEAFATQLGIDQSLLSRWERGVRIPSLENLLRVAGRLHLPISEIVVADDEAGAAAGG